MKICAACSQELPKDNFSNKQWQAKQQRRRCKECIAENREVATSTTAAETSPSGVGSAAVCGGGTIPGGVNVKTAFVLPNSGTTTAASGMNTPSRNPSRDATIHSATGVDEALTSPDQSPGDPTTDEIQALFDSIMNASPPRKDSKWI